MKSQEKEWPSKELQKKNSWFGQKWPTIFLALQCKKALNSNFFICVDNLICKGTEAFYTNVKKQY